MNTQQHKSLNILVIGDACIDKYHYGTCDRLSPEAPVPIFKHTYTEKREGMCLNVANNLAAFEAEASILCNKEMIYKERFVDIKTKQQLLRSDFGENGNVKPLSITEIKKVSLEPYDAVIISDYNKGYITHDVATLIAKLCLQNNILLFVDSKKRDLSCFDGGFIKINEDEFRQVTRFPQNYELIVTLGAAGARWNDKIYETVECEVFDISGAGDTFLASFAYGYLCTESTERGINFANMCSRFVVQKFGTYCLKKEDLKQI